MSTRKAQFESLQLGSKLDNIIQTWSGLKTDNLQGGNLENVERLIRVLALLKHHITNIDIELLPVSAWNNFPNNIANLQNHATNFKSNRNVGYIQNANNEVDSMLSAFRPLSIENSPDFSKSLAQSSEEFTKKVLELFDIIKNEREDWLNQLQTLSNSLSDIKNHSTETDNTIQEQKKRLDTSIAEFQKQFSEAQEKRIADFATASKQNTETITKLVADQKSKFEAEIKWIAEAHQKILQKNAEESDSSLKRVTEIEEKVRKIFNVVGNIALTGNYDITAVNENKAANKFRWISLGLMGLMAAVAGYTFYHSLLHPEVDWKLFAFRLGTTIIIALPALYAAQESAKHREREKMNRKIHLELSAIDAYLELLPEAKKHELKGQLTEKFFGQNDPQSKDEPVTKHDLFDLLSTALKNISKLK